MPVTPWAPWFRARHRGFISKSPRPFSVRNRTPTVRNRTQRIGFCCVLLRTAGWTHSEKCDVCFFTVNCSDWTYRWCLHTVVAKLRALGAIYASDIKCFVTLYCVMNLRSVAYLCHGSVAFCCVPPNISKNCVMSIRHCVMSISHCVLLRTEMA